MQEVKMIGAVVPEEVRRIGNKVNRKANTTRRTKVGFDR